MIEIVKFFGLFFAAAIGGGLAGVIYSLLGYGAGSEYWVLYGYLGENIGCAAIFLGYYALALQDVLG